MRRARTRPRTQRTPRVSKRASKAQSPPVGGARSRSALKRLSRKAIVDAIFSERLYHWSVFTVPGSRASTEAAVGRWKGGWVQIVPGIENEEFFIPQGRFLWKRQLRTWQAKWGIFGGADIGEDTIKVTHAANKYGPLETRKYGDNARVALYWKRGKFFIRLEWPRQQPLPF